MKITGPHYCIGAACAAGNAGVIQGIQMLRLGEVDLAIAGGVSESPHTFGIFAAFAAETALATHQDPAKASRPFDINRNGIVISEGGCLFTLERLSDAKRRGAKIYAEIVGYAMNSDASDFVLPNPQRQAECMQKALTRAGLQPEDIDIISTHATATASGDIQEIAAIRKVFGNSKTTYINNTKSFIGHAMGAVGCLELAGNLLSLEDGIVHPTINCDELDPECAIDNLVIGTPKNIGAANYILNNSFGMVGINSVLIAGKCKG
jgi:3-oxoacyl-[acyl-carrier-protein] synthase II